MQSNDAFLTSNIHKQRRHVPHINPPFYSGGFILRPTFFLLRVFYRLLVFIIILIGLSDYWMPFIADQKHVVEAEASNFLGTQVTIGDISYDRTSDNPRWILQDVTLTDNDDKTKKASIKELSMTLDLIESLRTIRLQPAKIQASGVDVTLLQDLNGEFHVNGLKLPIAGFSSGAGRKKPLHINVNGGTAHWINLQTRKQLDLQDLSFKGKATSTLFEAEIKATPPLSVGKPLEISVELNHDKNALLKPKDKKKYWSGVINVQGEITQPSALPVDLHKYTGIIDGDLGFYIDALIQKNQAVQLDGKLVINKPVLEQALHITKDLDKLYHQDLQSLTIDGHWAADQTEWEAQFALEIEKNNKKQKSNINFDHQLTPNGFNLNASVDAIDLDHYLPLLERQQWLNKKISHFLTALKPRGQLANFSLFLDVDENNPIKTQIQGKGSVKNISIQAHEKIPSLEGINAEFDFNKNIGTIKISLKNSQIDYSRWFEKPIQVNELTANLHWEKTAKEWQLSLQKLHFTNDDAHVKGVGKLVLDQANTPYLDLDFDFSSNRKIRNIRRYIPSFISDKGEKWLKTAIKSGVVPQGKLRLKGNLKKFPFTNSKDGMFLTWFEVKEGKLKYLPNWPIASNVAGTVTFINQGMFANINSAVVLKNKISSGYLHIPDFRQNPEITIKQLKTNGKLVHQINYLSQSPLGRGVKDFLTSSKFTGSSNLEIAIHAHLKKKGSVPIKKTITVDGSIKLSKASANFTSIKQHFKNVRGTATFNQHGFSTKKLTAQYKKEKVLVSASLSKNKKHINVLLKQSNDIQNLADGVIDPLAAYLSGKISYHANLQLPSYSLLHPNKNKKISLAVHSDLEGMKSTLPIPFRKSANETRDFSLMWESSKKNKSSIYKVAYSPLLSARYQPSEDGIRLGISIGGSTAKLPASGISIDGNLNQTNIIDWKPIITGGVSSAKKSHNVDVNLTINKLLLGKKNQGFSHIEVSKKGNRTVAQLYSEKLKASINKTSNNLNVTLSNLDIDALTNSIGQNNKASSALSPKQFPTMNLVCNHCTTKGRSFDRLTLQMVNRGEYNLVNLVDVSGKNYQLSASGTWSPDGSGGSITQLQIQKAYLNKPGEFLSEMGDSAKIRNGKTKITGNLRWQGSPLDFQLKRLSGDVHLSMQKGRINDVKTGAGKLLALLNISKFGRRLRLDFSDVPRKGIQFDRITGDIRLNRGVLSTQNTIIESSIMLAGIEGETDLVRKTHNQTITIIPDIKSALPTVGLLFGGVGIGAAIALLDKLTEKNEKKQLKNKDVGTRYQITGSWNDPIITDISPVAAPEDFD